MKPTAIAGVVILVAVLLAGVCALAWRRADRPTAIADAELALALPRMNAAPSFAASIQCRQCHPQEYTSWHDSYHRKMTQVARPETVLGSYEGVEIEDAGQIHRLSRRGDELWVETFAAANRTNDVQPPPKSEARRVVMTTGAHHMQVSWASAGTGNLLNELPIVYLRDDRPGKSRWAPLEASYLSPSAPGPHSETHWNTSCILCHATGGVPGLQSAGATDTAVAELGIACEACHGPGQRHVQLMQRRAGGADDPPNTLADLAIVNPARLRPERTAQVCGHCHAAASFVTDYLVEDFFLSGSAYRPGDDLTQTRLAVLPARLTEEQKEANRRINPFFDGSYWPDGMIRVAGREYNGLLESTCYQQGGMTCLSCHSMHQSDPNDQLAAEMDGNQACYQCHASYRETLREHTHHQADSSGSLCYNCHMPHTTYGLFKAIRSHQISSPNVATTLATGRLTACNSCHLDQTLAWTSEHLSQWYGHPVAELDADQQSLSAAACLLLKGDPVQRALLSWIAGWQPALDVSGRQWLAPILARLLDDPSPVMRMVSSRSLEANDPRYAVEYDFIGPSEGRQAAVRRVVEIWASLPLEQRKKLPKRVFVLPDGSSDEKEIERLLMQRDNRRLQVNE
ncbi:MAG TPA: cytochrome c3 family protein [Pirellulales bacterium]|nr:cytochrome c3 family protein [Pirellulales bacterium]